MHSFHEFFPWMLWVWLIVRPSQHPNMLSHFRRIWRNSPALFDCNVFNMSFYLSFNWKYVLIFTAFVYLNINTLKMWNNNKETIDNLSKFILNDNWLTCLYFWIFSVLIWLLVWCKSLIVVKLLNFDLAFDDKMIHNFTIYSGISTNKVLSCRAITHAHIFIYSFW